MLYLFVVALLRRSLTPKTLRMPRPPARLLPNVPVLPLLRLPLLLLLPRWRCLPVTMMYLFLQRMVMTTWRWKRSTSLMPVPVTYLKDGL